MKVAVIQARMSSRRLPGKSLAKLCGKPLIEHVVERVSACDSIEKVIVATTHNKADDQLIRWAASYGVATYRGSEDDVLSRFLGAAQESGASVIARVTADDPFKDPEVTDRVVGLLIEKELDFACNNFPPSFPEGLDAEVFTIDALRRANENSRSAFEREHVTQHFYKNPKLFKQENVSHEKDLSKLRWTIDTKRDYEMARRVYDELYRESRIFKMREILDLLDRRPEIRLLNDGEERSSMYREIG